jgi:hypothetical protein
MDLDLFHGVLALVEEMLGLEHLAEAAFRKYLGLLKLQGIPVLLKILGVLVFMGAFLVPEDELFLEVLPGLLLLFNFYEVYQWHLPDIVRVLHNFETWHLFVTSYFHIRIKLGRLLLSVAVVLCNYLLRFFVTF